MEVTARLRYVHGSAQKMRLVADLIRGKAVQDAVNLLGVTHKAAARHVQKCLKSAIANAEHNLGADIDQLKVARIEIDTAPVLKRFAARAKGRGNRIVKRNSHITVQVSDGRKD